MGELITELGSLIDVGGGFPVCASVMQKQIKLVKCILFTNISVASLPSAKQRTSSAQEKALTCNTTTIKLTVHVRLRLTFPSTRSCHPSSASPFPAATGCAGCCCCCCGCCCCSLPSGRSTFQVLLYDPSRWEVQDSRSPSSLAKQNNSGWSSSACSPSPCRMWHLSLLWLLLLLLPLDVAVGKNERAPLIEGVCARFVQRYPQFFFFFEKAATKRM